MTAPVSVVVAPGTLYQLRCGPAAGKTTVLDANGTALDDSTARAVATLTLQNGAGAVVSGLNAATVPYESPNAWHLNIPGANTLVARLPARLRAQLTDISGTYIRLQSDFSLVPAAPAVLRYSPGTGYTFWVSGLAYQGAPATGATVSGLVTVIDQGGLGSLVASQAMVYDLGAGEWFGDVDGAMFVAGGLLLVTAQMSDLGGNNIWAQQWLCYANG